MMEFMFLEEEIEASLQLRLHSSSAFPPALSRFPLLPLKALGTKTVSIRISVIHATSTELDPRHLILRSDNSGFVSEFPQLTMWTVCRTDQMMPT